MQQAYNLPNILVYFRIMLAPLMLWFLIDRTNPIFATWHPSWLDYFAGLIFVLASITDFFDGYIARLWNQQTLIGSILDPLADKMLMLAGFLGLLALERINIWAVFIILAREFLITGLRIVAIGKGHDIQASFLGKAKTVLQMIALGFLIMDWSGATLLLWIAVLATIYSGYEYIREFQTLTK